MMMRLPDRVFRVMERVYHTQRAIRREEQRCRLETEDAMMREYFRRLEATHDAGACGGAAGGCRYAPCFMVEDWRDAYRGASDAAA